MKDWTKYEIGMEEKGKFYDIVVGSGRFPSGYYYFGAWYDGLYFQQLNSGGTDRSFILKIRESRIPHNLLEEFKATQDETRYLI